MGGHTSSPKKPKSSKEGNSSTSNEKHDKTPAGGTSTVGASANSAETKTENDPPASTADTKTEDDPPASTADAKTENSPPASTADAKTENSSPASTVETKTDNSTEESDQQKQQPENSSGKVSVDYDAVRRDLKAIMVDPNWDDGSYAPLLIRLAWHSCGTYDANTNTGGSFQSGATMRHAVEAADPENAGLGQARLVLEPIKRKHANISYADLWILAAYVALEVTDGPVLDFTPGRTDGGPEKAIKPGRLPEAEHGIAPGVDAEGRPNQWQNLAAHLRQVFGRMGLSEREMVALMCGGHAYGRCHQEHSGYGGAWIEMPIRFSNEYAADMIEDNWMLIGHDTKLSDGTAVPPDVCPMAGKRQFIGVPDEEEEEEDDKAEKHTLNAKDFADLPPGQYRLDAEWVNCRESPDTTSPVLARPEKGALFNVMVVKQFETAVRGQLETGGWVSLQALSGARYWTRVGDIALCDGAHRVSVGKRAAAFDSVPADAMSAGQSFVQETTWLALTEVQCHPQDPTVIFGKVTEARALSQGPSARKITAKAVGQWVRLSSGEGGVVVERIVKGFNEKPRKPLKQISHQMMLVADMVLLWDEGFRPHLEDYAKDIDLLKREFGCAFKKLTELGCPCTKIRSQEIEKKTEKKIEKPTETDDAVAAAAAASGANIDFNASDAVQPEPDAKTESS